MNKTELIAAVAEKTGETKKAATENVTAVLDAIQECLVKGESVALVGFGTFSAKVKPARTAKNPRTGETVKIPQRTVPAFKAGKALIEAVGKK